MSRILNRIFKLLVWAIVGCVILWIILFFVVLRLNTVTGSSTVIFYKFNPREIPFETVSKKIDLIASQHGLSRYGTSRQMTTVGGEILGAIWDGRPTLWWSERSQKIKISLYFSAEDLNSEIPKGHLSISTSEADKGNEWQAAAKTIETILAPHVDFIEANVQLESRAYGLCMSDSRADRMDTYCHHSVSVPVDFLSLNEKILTPRAVEVLKNSP